MKILYVLHSLTVGGAETIAVNYLIELKKRGHNVALLQVNACDSFLRDRLTQAGISVFTAEDYLKSGCSLARKLSRAIGFRHFVKAFNPDIIHVHSGLEKLRFAHFPAGRIVYTIHSSFERSLQNGKNYRKVFFRQVQSGMTVCVLSKQGRDDLLNCISSAKVEVIPNGMDLHRIKDAHCDRIAARKELGIPEQSFVVGHIGRFHPVKNHEKVISVFAEILRRNPDAYLLLLGSGSQDETAHVRDLIRQAGIEGHVRMPGVRKDAVALMDIMDVLLLPSHSEAFPLVLIEAQAKGKHVVASNTHPEEICATGCISRLSLDDPDTDWASAATEKASFSADNRDEIPQELMTFDIATVITQHEALYQRCLDA